MANSQTRDDRDLSILEAAEKLAPAEAAERARSDVAGQRDDPQPERLREMGLYARANADYRKVLDQEPALAKEVKDALIVGEPMPRAEWAQAKQLSGSNGRVYLPKAHTDYAGKIVMVTDTHVVQQAGKSSVVAHDLSKLENRQDLDKLNAEGKLQNKVLKVSYGTSAARAEVLTFTQVRAAEVAKAAADYARESIKSPQARENFVKHVQKMMDAEIARSQAPKAPAQQPARQPERTPERSR
jgi:hypothetical protein